MKTRVDHIDIAKGISIVLVALAHSKLTVFAPEIEHSMGLFRMPLFFFLSGVFFSTPASAKTFLWKKSDALLKPYFTTLLVVFVITALFREDYSIWPLVKILYGNGNTTNWGPMWFLTHLFAVYCFTYFAFRITGIQERTILYKITFILMLMTGGIYWIDVFWLVEITLFGKEFRLPGLPFSFDIIFISSSYFIAGAFLRKMVTNFNPSNYLLYMSVFTFFIVTIFSDARIRLWDREYIAPLFATAGAICGIYFVIYFSYYINKSKALRKIFLAFGQASLFILIFHAFLGALVYNYLNELGKNEFVFLYAVIAFLISIIAPLLIKSIVSRSEGLSLFYMPVKSINLIK